MRRTPFLLGAALTLAGCGGSHAALTTTTHRAATTQLDGARVPNRIAPPIALHDAGGHRVTLASFRGGYTLVTFLYTHCPDVCPLIAANLNQALHLVAARRHHVNVIAVSVDPSGDTPAAVRAFVREKHLAPQFHYLIGTRAELRPVWVAYNVTAVAQQAKLVTHVAYTMLVDPSGRERLVYDAQVRAGEVAHDLDALLHLP